MVAHRNFSLRDVLLTKPSFEIFPGGGEEFHLPNQKNECKMHFFFARILSPFAF